MDIVVAPVLSQSVCAHHAEWRVIFIDRCCAMQSPRFI